MQLSERAAEDLIAFVRRVRRESERWSTESTRSVALANLAEFAMRILDKHDLSTFADDPGVAAVFVEDESGECSCGCGKFAEECPSPFSQRVRLSRPHVLRGQPQRCRIFAASALANE